ncbi:MAG: tetratricopeptide repeat protein [bacterium]
MNFKTFKRILKHLPYYRISCWLIDHIAIFVLSFTAFAIPLYYDYSINNIYVLPKVVLMRHLTIILLGLFFFRTLILKKGIEKPAIFLPIIAFAICSSIATTQSLNPFVSLFGCYSRYEGLTSLLNYIILFYLAFFFIKKGYQARIFFTSCVLSGLLSGGYGFLQHFDKDPNWLVEMGESSTFGNKNFLSAYLVLLCPLSFSLFLLSWDDKIKKKRKAIIKILFNMGKFLQASFFFLSFLFFIVTIIIIRTRGAWLGLLGEGVLFLALLGKNLFKKRYLYILILLLISIIPLFFFKETSPIGRIKGTFKVKKGVELTGSALVRIYIWKSTLDLILHHPLGVGPDSLKFTIPLYLLPDYWTIEGGVLDKVHNIILEIAATTGWLGILSYTSLWISLFIFGVKNRKNILTIAVLSSSIGYLIQNLFNFDLITYTFLFWSGMGVLFGINREKEKLLATSFKLSGIRIILFIPFVFLLLFLWKVSNIQIEADKVFAQARNYEAAGDLDGSISLYEKALSFLPYEETYFRFLIPQYKNKIEKTEDKEIIKKIILRIEDAARYDPNNTSYYDTLAIAYQKLYQLGDKDGLKKGEESLKRGVKQNPNSPETWTNLGVFYSERGRIKDAIKTYTEALKYQKEGVRGRVLTLNNLGEAYFRDNQLDRAIWALKESLKTKNDQGEIYHYLALVYFKKEDYKNSAKECQKAVNFSPDNVSWLNDLGSAYYKAGDLKRAKEAFKKALLLDPSNEYAKRVLSVIK